MFMLQCNGCRATAFTEAASDPDPLVACLPDSDCCKESHHHGQAANESGTACRPITITAMPGSVTVTPAIPGSV